MPKKRNANRNKYTLTGRDECGIEVDKTVLYNAGMAAFTARSWAAKRGLRVNVYPALSDEAREAGEKRWHAGSE